MPGVFAIWSVHARSIEDTPRYIHKIKLVFDKRTGYMSINLSTILSIL